MARSKSGRGKREETRAGGESKVPGKTGGPLPGHEWPLPGHEWPLPGHEWPLPGHEWPLPGHESAPAAAAAVGNADSTARDAPDVQHAPRKRFVATKVEI